MAIVKTMFTGRTLAAQAPELLAYLQANASGFFDEITADSDGNITCYVGDTPALIIGMDGTTTRRVTLKNGNYIELTSVTTANNPRSTLFSYAKRTNSGGNTATTSGLLLVTAPAKVSTQNVGPTTIFITKNDTGDTCIYGYMQTTNSSSSTATYFCADIDNDTTIFTPLTNTTYENRAQLSRSAAVTSLTPVIFNGGHHAPKGYIAIFNQYALTECDLNIGGRSYISDGVGVLSD